MKTKTLTKRSSIHEMVGIAKWDGIDAVTAIREVRKKLSVKDINLDEINSL